MIADSTSLQTRGGNRPSVDDKLFPPVLRGSRQAYKRQIVQVHLDEFWKKLNQLRNTCILCYFETQKNHPERDGDTSCYRKYNACFKCLRDKCGYKNCPLFSDMRPLGTGRHSSQTPMETGAFPRSLADSQSLYKGSLGAKQSGTFPNVCFGCGLMKFHHLNLHTVGEIGRKCVVKKAFQICIRAWTLSVGRKSIIRKFNLPQDLDNDTDASVFSFLQWLKEYDNAEEKFNIMHAFF